MGKAETYYDVLQVQESASTEVIRGAYRYLSQKWHPDRNVNNEVEANFKIRKINEACDVLRDVNKRAAYDDFLKSERNQQRYTRASSEVSPSHECSDKENKNEVKESNGSYFWYWIFLSIVCFAVFKIFGFIAGALLLVTYFIARIKINFFGSVLLSILVGVFVSIVISATYMDKLDYSRPVVVESDVHNNGKVNKNYKESGVYYEKGGQVNFPDDATISLGKPDSGVSSAEDVEVFRLVSSSGHVFEVNETSDGFRLESKSYGVLYLGKSCDALSGVGGRGYWFQPEGSIMVQLEEGGVEFQGQFFSYSGCSSYSLPLNIFKGIAISKSGKVYSVSKTDHGLVLSSSEFGTLYIGRSCDVLSTKYGEGYWFIKDNDLLVHLDVGRVNFPRLEVDNSSCIDPSVYEK